MAIGINHYIVRLEVSVDDVSSVQVLKSKEDFREIVPCPLF